MCRNRPRVPFRSCQKGAPAALSVEIEAPEVVSESAGTRKTLLQVPFLRTRGRPSPGVSGLRLPNSTNFAYYTYTWLRQLLARWLRSDPVVVAWTP